MSKKPNHSKPNTCQQRNKTFCGRKTPRAPDLSMYQKQPQKRSNTKAHQKTRNIQKKLNKPKDLQSLPPPISKNKTPEECNLKATSSTNDGNVVIQCVKQVFSSISKDNINAKNSPLPKTKSFTYSKDKIVENCDLSKLKNLVSSKLNDCSFFTDEENNKKGSKRLLFMEYRKKEVFINGSSQKGEVREKSIPKEIKRIFEGARGEGNRGEKVETEETENTTDSGNRTEKTPLIFTPREIEYTTSVDKSIPLTCSQSVVLLPEKSLQSLVPSIEQQALFYPQTMYWNQNMTMSFDSPSYFQPPYIPRTNNLKNRGFQIDINTLQQDGRTTLMIKNIPNKCSRAQLIKLFDKIVYGKYDFLYLPIDTYNQCNIGYAFINFVEYSSIRDFYNKFNGRRWEGYYNSDKICKLNYARVQGSTIFEEAIEETAVRVGERQISFYQ